MTYWLRERKDLEGSTSNNTLSSSVQINKMSSWDTNNGTNTFSDNSKMIPPWKLLELAQKMRREISVEDRRWNFKIYKKMFLRVGGFELVETPNAYGNAVIRRVIQRSRFSR
jgi:hypothetical protein